MILGADLIGVCRPGRAHADGAHRLHLVAGPGLSEAFDPTCAQPAQIENRRAPVRAGHGAQRKAGQAGPL